MKNTIQKVTTGQCIHKTQFLPAHPSRWEGILIENSAVIHSTSNFLLFHRIMEYFELSGTFQVYLVVYLVQPPEQGRVQLDQVVQDPSQLTSDVSRDEPSTTSLSNLFQSWSSPCCCHGKIYPYI